MTKAKPGPLPVCGAKAKSTGLPCQKPAGWATDHVGTGRCKLHGGRLGKRLKHGRYSVQMKESLQAKIQEFESDPLAGDLGGELALARALLQHYMDQFNANPIATDDYTRVFSMIETIGRLVERIATILSKTALTQAELQMLQIRLSDAVNEFIPDPTDQRAFISRIFGPVEAGIPPGGRTVSAIAEDPDPAD